MKEEQEKPKGSMANVALIVSLAVALGMVGLVFYLKKRAETMQTRLADCKKQYEDMKRMKPRVLELVARGPRVIQDLDPQGVPAFLESKARQVGLPAPSVRATRPPKAGGWQEWETTVELQGARDSSIPWGPITDFMSAVERERPQLKTKNLNVIFSDGPDAKSASIVISYFKRE